MSQERPDPDSIRTRADLGRELSALRRAAGLTVRELARRLGTPPATLGGYFAGSHLPSLSQLDLYRSVVAECGVHSAAEVERWERALDRARLASDGRATKGATPYRGLEAFGEGDAEFFFGRAAATDELLGELRKLRDDPGPSRGVLVLVGPSGSGKSSLLGAGLVPAIRAGALDTPGVTWSCHLSTPSGAAGLLEAPVPKDGRRTVLVVDQFEEVLADPSAAAMRTALLEALVRPDRAAELVVLGLRADYYGAAAAEPVLLAALRHAQVLLGPMTEGEVREAVTGPARAVGAAIKDGLVDLVLADLAPGSPLGFAHHAGALPLLSHALLVTWERAPRNELTIADYRAAGGLRGAVRQSAEELYQELSPPDQELARRIFTRLVRIEEDGPLARRRTRRQELVALTEGPDARGAVERVLERFVTGRLLTADAETVEVSHEALLGAWPRLADWIDADRAGLRVHHQVSDAARAWDATKRDGALLWRGTPLEAALEWSTTAGHDADLNRTERAFLDAAVAQRNAEHRATRRRTRRMQQLLVVAVTLALAASGLAVYAFNAQSSANRTRDQALSRQVAIEAEQLRATEPSLAAQLALSAYHIAPTVQARSALLEASGGEIPTRLLGPLGPEFLATADNGRVIAVAQSANDTVQLYSVSGGHLRRRARVVVGPNGAQDFAVALSPDGRLLAAGNTADHVVLWNLADPTRPTKLATLGGFSSTVYRVDFSPDGHQLAAADNDGTVGQWDISNPARPRPEPTIHAPGTAAMKALAYSPSGDLLAAGGATGTLVTWTPGKANASVVAGAGTTTIESIAFGPGGHMLASGGNDDLIHLWKVSSTGQVQVARPPISPGTAVVSCVAFSPGGTTLAACWESSVVLYSTKTWQQVASFPTSKPATSAVFSPDGATLTTADAGGVTRRWHLPPLSSFQVPGEAFFVQYTAKGTMLTATTAGPTGDVTFFDDRNPLHPHKVAALTMPASFGPIAGTATLGPRGHLMAVASTSAEIQLVDVRDPKHPRLVGSPLLGDKPYVEQVAFTPNAKVLVSGDDSGQVRMWDVADPAHPKSLPTLHVTKGKVLGIAISHTGHLLATCSTDGKTRLYDIADPTHPRLLTTLAGFKSYAYYAAFTPHDRILVAVSAGGTLRLWSLADPAHPKPLAKVLTGLTGDLYQVAVGQRGHTLAIATTDHSVGLWDIADPSRPQHLATLDTGTGALFAVAFDPRGHTVAAAGNEDTVYLWDYRVTDAARLVCTQAGHRITRAEWHEYVQGAAYAPPCGKQGKDPATRSPT